MSAFGAGHMSNNMAAIREALEDSQSLLENFSWGGYGPQVREQMRDNQAALAAPPRNCDVYKTSWDVVTHWDGGLDSAQNIVHMLDWLLAPVKPEIKGEAK